MQKKVASMFVAYTNIENYNNGCLQYGLAKEFTVQSADLWEGRKGPFLNVINNIHSLGFLVSVSGSGDAHVYGREGRGGGTGDMEACVCWGSGSDFNKLCG